MLVSQVAVTKGDSAILGSRSAEGKVGQSGLHDKLSNSLRNSFNFLVLLMVAVVL